MNDAPKRIWAECGANDDEWPANCESGEWEASPCVTGGSWQQEYIRADVAAARIAEAVAAETIRCAGVARMAMIGNKDIDELSCSLIAAAIRQSASDE